MTVIRLDGVVGWDFSAKEINNMIDSIEGDITLEMNSGGGFITEGVSMLNTIRDYNRGKVTARVSYAASMMTQIALACDEVQVYDNAIFMIHNAQGGVVGDHRELRKQADIQDRMSAMLAQLYVKKTSKSLEEIKEMMDNDTYLFGSEIVESGFADEVINTGAEKSKLTAVNTSALKLENVYKAMKEEALTASQLEDNFKMCVGNCNIKNEVATDALAPSEKTANLNTGVAMKFNKDNLEETEMQFNALVLNRDTLTNRNKSLKLELETKTVALEALQADMETFKADMEAKVAGAKQELSSFKAETEMRVQEAVSYGADAETIVSAIHADTKEDATKIILATKESAGATTQTSSKPVKGSWDEFSFGGKK